MSGKRVIALGIIGLLIFSSCNKNDTKTPTGSENSSKEVTSVKKENSVKNQILILR